MDSHKFMVIDTSKKGTAKMYITSQVSQIFYEEGMWHVLFSTSPTIYKYRYERIVFLKNPEIVDVDIHGFYLHNKHITNINKVYRFSTSGRYYYHAVYDEGYECDYDDNDVYVSRTTLDECGGDTFKYLNQIASEIGIVTDNGVNLLKKQYEKIDRERDNVPLARYIGDKRKLTVRSMPNTVIYPFSCNSSQIKAVENALTNQLSIIQGPPGTGKTQTILNIIANLLMRDKKVLVVSNNNSAVENVAEKLSSDNIGLGFLIAKLGNKLNKEYFIENQTEKSDISGWLIKENNDKEIKIRNTIDVVSKGFEVQNKMACLKIELQELKTERKYNDIYMRDMENDNRIFNKVPAKCILSFRRSYEHNIEHGRLHNLLFRIKWMFKLGFRINALLKYPANKLIEILDKEYYEVRIEEIEAEISECEQYLRTIDLSENLKILTSCSLSLLRHKIALKWNNRVHHKFKYEDITRYSEEFLEDYPIVLSTAYSCKNCINKDLVFDYIIMDEASQVDIVTGALTLSCATNVVIVGDDKQLPNVMDNNMKKAVVTIENLYGIEDKYRCSTHSFLQSCCETFTEAPRILLREHYRCHPKIIEFCNKMFYDGELITMTHDKNEENVISVIRTVEGQHARNHFNQREIDVIKSEVMPNFEKTDTVGIISPYRNQAENINQQLGCDIASTVHKYQGRECDSIVMSMVDNIITPFSDDANLLNVAVSRAKNNLCMVVTGNDIPTDSNIGQFIEYVRYNNFDVSESKVNSVFDILYKQYTEERMAFERSEHKDLGELSENIIYELIIKCISLKGYSNIGLLAHYPLNRLISDMRTFTEEERKFVSNEMTHVDFLLYNKVTKHPMLCIEVDGWVFHHMDVQHKRDMMKDALLDKCQLRHLRLSTVDTVNEDTICRILEEGISIQTVSAKVEDIN